MNDVCVGADASEHAYLVARGVRALAIAGNCLADAVTMFQVASELENHALPGAIAFVSPRDDGVADYGYAACRWVIDTLQWVQSDAVPTAHRHRIIGLLLGYSALAIREFEEGCSGRRFSEPTRVGTGST